MKKELTRETFDLLVSRLYAGGAPVFGSKEDDVFVLVHWIRDTDLALEKIVRHWDGYADEPDIEDIRNLLLKTNE